MRPADEEARAADAPLVPTRGDLRTHGPSWRERGRLAFALAGIGAGLVAAFARPLWALAASATAVLLGFLARSLERPVRVVAVTHDDATGCVRLELDDGRVLALPAHGLAGASLARDPQAPARSVVVLTKRDGGTLATRSFEPKEESAARDLVARLAQRLGRGSHRGSHEDAKASSLASLAAVPGIRIRRAPSRGYRAGPDSESFEVGWSTAWRPVRFAAHLAMLLGTATILPLLFPTVGAVNVLSTFLLLVATAATLVMVGNLGGSVVVRIDDAALSVETHRFARTRKHAFPLASIEGVAVSRLGAAHYLELRVSPSHVADERLGDALREATTRQLSGGHWARLEAEAVALVIDAAISQHRRAT